MSEPHWASLAPELKQGTAITAAALRDRLRRTGLPSPDAEMKIQAALDAGWLCFDRKFDIIAGPRLVAAPDYYATIEEARAREARERGRE